MTSMRPWHRDPLFWAILLTGVALLAVAHALLGPGLRAPLMVLLLLIVVFPVLEEIVFRGFIQPLLLKWTDAALGPVTLANVLTSIAFALAHLPAHGGLHATLVFVPSLFFGLFRDRHDSLVSPIVLHVAWNAAAVLLLGRFSIQL